MRKSQKCNNVVWIFLHSMNMRPLSSRSPCFRYDTNNPDGSPLNIYFNIAPHELYSFFSSPLLPRGAEPHVALRVRVHDPCVVIGICELTMPLSPPWHL